MDASRRTSSPRFEAADSSLRRPPPRRPDEDAEEEAEEEAEVADDDEAGGSPELPLTMSASVVLADLPRDAAAALASAVAGPSASSSSTTTMMTGGAAVTGPGARAVDAKVVVRFKAVGAAPGLAQDVCKISASRRFEEVVRYLRRKLRCGDSDSVFLYVNSAFAPSLDEVVGNLHQCFKNAQDQLIVAYSVTPAFG